jgi:hypothetical protein
MKNWLLWLLGKSEMAELERRRVAWTESRRWLAEFDDIAIVLDHLEAEGIGNNTEKLSDLRDRIRTLRTK